MNFLLRWIFLCAFVAAQGLSTARAQSAAAPVPPPAWPVTTSPARLIIETTRPDIKTLVGWTHILVPDTKWETMPIRVFTDTGTAVGSDVLWTAPGEPLTLVFDTSSGAKKYQVYFGSNWPLLHLTDKQAGVWLETREGDGKSIAHAPDMLDAWKKNADHVLGRDLTAGIFEGGNRFGPQKNLFLHMQGWFDLPADAHMDFGTVSTDASFVFIDGKPVVEWPGNHDFHYGAAPPQGGVDLTAGLHGIDYYNAYTAKPDGWPPVMASLLAKGGPLANWTMLMPNKGLLRQAALYNVSNYELQQAAAPASHPGEAPPRAIVTNFESESLINSDNADVGLIMTALAFYPKSTATATWAFDDGTTAQGWLVKHLFPRAGLRTVSVSVQDEGKPVETVSHVVNIHNRWTNLPGQPPSLSNDHEAEILHRDPNTFTASDLVSTFALFGWYKKTDDLLKLLPALCTKMAEVKESDLPYVRDAALVLIHDDHLHSAEQIQLLRAIIDRVGKLPPSPDINATASRCRLALARLLLQTTDHTDEVLALVDAVAVPTLKDDEPRSLDILRADLLLAKGDIAAAKKKYTDLTGEPTGPDARSSIRRTARIGQARAYMDQKDYDSANDALSEVAWKAPIEKMSSDWALTKLRLYQEENRPVEATLWAKRLLPIINGDGRAELLFRLTGLAFAQKDDDLARKTLSELLKKYPYSSEAAQAKEKWPGQQ